MKRLPLILVLLLVSIVSGFYQEKLKISINYILEQGGRYPDFDRLNPEEKQKVIESARADAPFDYYHNHETITALYRFDAQDLAGLKWAVTGGFLIWFLLLNFIMLRTLGVQENAIRSLPIIYLSLAMLALIIYAGSKVGLNADHCYAVSRKIMGALQSIIPTFIIWPASKLWNNGKSITRI
jgi:hypothetical protein